MSDVTWTHPFLADILGYIPTNVKSLLDVGCGRGIIGALMRIYRNPDRIVGLDAFRPYVDFCRRHNLYDEVYCYDLRNIPLPFDDEEFAVATCVETIEHLPKQNGKKLLSELERLADLIIVTTPTLSFHQPTFDNNPFQGHLSDWSVSDFLKRDYKVEGFGEFRIKGRRIRYVSSFLTPLSRRKFPQFSAFLLARKMRKSG